MKKRIYLTLLFSQSMPSPQSPSLSDTPNSQFVHRAHALTELRDLCSRLRVKRMAPRSRVMLSALESRLARAREKVKPGGEMSPFDRMNQCRTALERLDANGWKRSYHQRLFHEDFLVCFISSLGSVYLEPRKSS